MKAESVRSNVPSTPDATSAQDAPLLLAVPAFARSRAIPPVWSIVVNGACFIVCAAAAIVILGWLRSQPALTRIIPGFGPMRWTKGLSLLALGLSLFIRRNGPPGRSSDVLADCLSFVALMLVTVSLTEYVTGPRPIYDRLDLGNGSILSGYTPGRMSPASCLGLALFAIALITLDRLEKLSTFLLSLGIMLSLAAVCGFLYQARRLQDGKLLDAISIQTSCSLLLLFAAGFAARPLREPLLSLFAPELGAEARLELLVGTWALPLFLGVLVKEGYSREWYGAPFAFGLFAVAVVSLQTFLIWRSDAALTRLTRNKQKMEEVLRKNEKLAVAGRLAASISHEINNPLEAISNLLYLIRTSDELPEQHRYADMASDELRRVSQITSQTLSFYRENTPPKLADVMPILQSSVQLLRGKISSLGIAVIEDYREPISPIICSTGELRQVLVNLISNALDATPRGGKIVIRARQSRAWTRAGSSVVRIAVADTGSGMPPAVLARVFEPFYTTKEKTGNGLGLWVASELVEKHGGWMKVRSSTSAPRQGTTFELVLPILEAS